VSKRFFRPVSLSLALLLIAAAFLRFYQLGEVPPGLFPDEATHALDALEVLDGQLTIYSPDEGSTGALWRYLLALHFAMFGAGLLSLRAFASALGVISVAVAYLAVRELSLSPFFAGSEARAGSGPPKAWREAIAALAALLLALSYWHLDLSRTAFSAVLMLLVQDAAFFCLWRGLSSGRRRWFVLFGVGLGLLAYNYLPGKLVPAVPLVFFFVEWLVARRDALVLRHHRALLAAAGLALLIALPFLAFAVFNYRELAARAALPAVGGLGAPSLLAGLRANLAVFGLWPSLWLSKQWGAFFLGPLLAACFVAGVGASLVRIRRPAYLFLLLWWLVMLLPGVLAPEGAVPHARRAIGAATPTFALAALGLATLVALAVEGLRRLLGGLIKTDRPAGAQAALLLSLSLGLALAVHTGAHTFRRYFIEWGPSEAARLAFHVYDLELADVMQRQGDAESVYLLPLDTAAGAINPLLDSITFVYRGRAAYDFLSDDEQLMPARLADLAAGKRVVHVVHWKVTKHTGADPKHVAHYLLEKWGRQRSIASYHYFDVQTYELDGQPGAFSPAALAPGDVSFEGEMSLVGHAFGDASGGPVGRASVRAGDLLWAELAWRKTGHAADDYQAGLWLEDEAGHVVGRADKPLLNNIWHRPAGAWPAGAEERDYYLLPVDPATPPGTYRLKAVLYTGQPAGRRLAPRLPGVGADLAVSLGGVTVEPPEPPPDPGGLGIPRRLDVDLGYGFRLLGWDPGLRGPLRPGDRATLQLWWLAQTAPGRDLAVAAGMGRGERAWPLSAPQPLGGAGYPTSEWPAGAVVRAFVDLRVPAEVETGQYNLGLRLLDLDSGEPVGDWLLGELRIEGRPRSFSVPSLSHPVHADFAGQARLLGYEIDASPVQEGGPPRLTLYWQAGREMQTAYKVFVHFLDEAGHIVAQVDREPQAGQAPTTGWLPGEVVADELEMPATPGLAAAHSIAVGLYDPATGGRLPVLDAGGLQTGDSVTFPIR
jgi:hypothetical protein